MAQSNFLHNLVKYHFWVLCGLAVAVSLACWAMSTSALSTQYTQRKQKLESDFQKMRSIEGVDKHPNQGVIGAVEKQQKALSAKVLDAWNELYKQQQAKNPWPEVLGEEFAAMMKELKPDEEIPENYRQTYQTFIQKHFAQLRDQIGVLKILEKAGAKKAENEDDAQRNVEYSGIVAWDEKDQKRIESAFTWSTVPLSVQVRLAQEDLWVYETLLRIIKDTNARSTTRYNAAIKSIATLAIGKEAAGAWLKLSAAKVEEKSGSSSGFGGGGKSSAASTAGEEAIGKQLRDGRYVDQNQRPLAASQPHPYPEFTMMPVDLELVMRQSDVPDLLAHCANSKMPVEVKLLRIRPGGLQDGKTASAAPYDPAAGHDTSEATAAAAEERSRDYVPVQLLGVIYIYNPPDATKLAEGGQRAAAGEGEPAPENPDEPAPDDSSAPPEPAEPQP